MTPEEAFDLVSNGARSVMGLPECGPWRGAVADMVAMPVRSMREAIADASSERIVFRAGREVARSSVSRSTVVDR